MWSAKNLNLKSDLDSEQVVSIAGYSAGKTNNLRAQLNSSQRQAFDVGDPESTSRALLVKTECATTDAKTKTRNDAARPSKFGHARISTAKGSEVVT